MPPNDQSTALEKIDSAKAAFGRCLMTFQEPGHYLSVRDKIVGPRQRGDGDGAFCRDRRAEDKAKYVWSDTKHRWVTKDGEDVYPENMIWDVVSYLLCDTRSQSAPEVFAEMSLAGSVYRVIDLDDMQRILSLWRQRGLDLDRNIKAIIGGTATQDVSQSNDTKSHVEEADEDQTTTGHDAHNSDNKADDHSKDSYQGGHSKFGKTAAGGFRKYWNGRTNVIPTP